MNCIIIEAALVVRLVPSPPQINIWIALHFKLGALAVTMSTEPTASHSLTGQVPPERHS